MRVGLPWKLFRLVLIPVRFNGEKNYLNMKPSPVFTERTATRARHHFMTKKIFMYILVI